MAMLLFAFIAFGLPVDLANQAQTIPYILKYSNTLPHPRHLPFYAAICSAPNLLVIVKIF